jgi:tRNA threonylcarbamoyladenosine modification (KEOPS) complex  Pcc1 subunit
MKVLIEIKFENVDDSLRKILFNSILLEKVDQRVVNIDKDKSLIIISANSISRGRAIMNSYISWIYTIIETLNKVKNNDRKNTPRA